MNIQLNEIRGTTTKWQVRRTGHGALPSLEERTGTSGTGSATIRRTNPFNMTWPVLGWRSGATISLVVVGPLCERVL